MQLLPLAVLTMLDTNVVVDDIDAVIDVLEQFRQGGDLADQLILARATSTGALPVLSFDRRFAASEGVERLDTG